MATESMDILKLKCRIRGNTVALRWLETVWNRVVYDAHPGFHRHKLVALFKLFAKLISIFDFLALLRALESLGVDLTLEVFIDGRHAALSISEVSA